MPTQKPFPTGAVLAFALLGAIVTAYVFLDRPLALFAFGNFHESRGPFVAITHFLDWMEAAAVASLVWASWMVARGKPFGGKGLIALRTTLALFLAMGAKELAKLAFGRTWPETWTGGNPSFIRDGAYGFSPFHGGAGWSSFPSGHETLVCAVAGCLWVLTPRLRPLCVVAALAMAVGLLGADYHWLSDVLAGGLMGWMIGVFVAKLELPRTVTASA
ncbi:phosphatase PAP2 family protein [Rhodoblastus sp. 17X3]|uniref:phosphatase PAP2 family protein n=1 Tax=Rhodoblastus sp. 17X3 TaxID=3047026 RepID=UPI0024B6A1F2|nr:phosphatase PAP2 family protein [Rhodoblastus sp. 17X3]MDI9849354.1 phosphatase PAP2 family protein [Rhodoblastus sp. 17X3]